MVNILAEDFNAKSASAVSGVFTQNELLRARYYARSGNITNEFSDNMDGDRYESRESKEQKANMLYSTAWNIVESRIRNLDLKISALTHDISGLHERIEDINNLLAAREAQRADLQKRYEEIKQEDEKLEKREQEIDAELAENNEIIDVNANENEARAQDLQNSEAVTIAVPGTESGVVAELEDGTLVAVDARTGEYIEPQNMSPEVLRSFNAVLPTAKAQGAILGINANTYSTTDVEKAQRRCSELYSERDEVGKAKQLLRHETRHIDREIRQLEREIEEKNEQKSFAEGELETKQQQLSSLQEQRERLVNVRNELPENATREDLASLLADVDLDKQWENALRPDNDSGLTYATNGLARVRTELSEIETQLEELGEASPEDPRFAALQERQDALRMERRHYGSVYDSIIEGDVSGAEALTQELQDSPYAAQWDSFASKYDSFVNGIKDVASAVSDGVGSAVSSVGTMVSGWISSDKAGSAASIYDPEGGTALSLAGTASGAFQAAASAAAPAVPQPAGPDLQGMQQQQQQQQIQLGM